MTKSLTFITGNPSKAEQVGWHLHREINHQKVELVEIQSLQLEEIIEYKAREAFRVVQGPVLVEDTSLLFSALGKLPGPLIKWFLQELDNDGLCELLNGYTDRSAKAMVLFGLYDGKNVQTFSGAMEGTIAKTPRGDRGFGWDPIFIPKGYKNTWGEMTKEEQAKTSMRRIALQKLEKDLMLTGML
jgi:non-canonical purine NTP pyrophosphatase (RdgB/HAM1 family)